MTDRDGNKVPASHWWAGTIMDKLAGFLISALLWVGAFVYATLFNDSVQAWVVGMAHAPQAIAAARAEDLAWRAETREEFKDIKRDIRVLQQPKEVSRFHLLSTRASDGYCIEGEPCDIHVKILREQAAVDCRVRDVDFGFIDRNTESFVGAEWLNPMAPQDAIPTGISGTVTLRPSFGLSPSAKIAILAQYSDCPGTIPGDVWLTRLMIGPNITIYDSPPEETAE